tara:strand:+ start:95 stop:811 length:717 start_codon:yes stop_codon:yes gene_type:complete
MPHLDYMSREGLKDVVDKPKEKPSVKGGGINEAKGIGGGALPTDKEKIGVQLYGNLIIDKNKVKKVKGGGLKKKNMKKKKMDCLPEEETHKMPDGTIHSGKVHTESSVPVKVCPRKSKKGMDKSYNSIMKSMVDLGHPVHHHIISSTASNLLTGGAVDLDLSDMNFSDKEKKAIDNLKCGCNKTLGGAMMDIAKSNSHSHLMNMLKKDKEIHNKNKTDQMGGAFVKTLGHIIKVGYNV